MSQEIHEHLSALMDGELRRDETQFLLRRMQHDTALAPCWDRMHVVRQVLRRQEVFALPDGFAIGVLERIGHEAVPARGRPLATWLRWGSGGAIAAGVAVMALVLTGSPDAPVGSEAGLAAASRPVPAAPVEFRAPVLGPALQAQPATFGSDAASAAPIDPRLQSYLIRHYEAAGTSGQTALAPYVLLIVPSQQQAANAAQAQEPAQRR